MVVKRICLKRWETRYLGQDVEEEDSIPSIIDAVMKTTRQSERGLAIKLKVSGNTVNQWRAGGTTPGPPYCWKIAELAGLPVEHVMRAAGHLPQSAEDDEPYDPSLPSWLTARLKELNEKELRPFGGVEE